MPNIWCKRPTRQKVRKAFLRMADRSGEHVSRHSSTVQEARSASHHRTNGTERVRPLRPKTLSTTATYFRSESPHGDKCEHLTTTT